MILKAASIPLLILVPPDALIELMREIKLGQFYSEILINPQRIRTELSNKTKLILSFSFKRLIKYSNVSITSFILKPPILPLLSITHTRSTPGLSVSGAPLLIFQTSISEVLSAVFKEMSAGKVLAIFELSRKAYLMGRSSKDSPLARSQFIFYPIPLTDSFKFMFKGSSAGID